LYNGSFQNDQNLCLKCAPPPHTHTEGHKRLMTTTLADNGRTGQTVPTLFWRKCRQKCIRCCLPSV